MRSFHVNRLALSEHKIAVILLAAGSSTRMIGARSKLLLHMPDGKSILSHAVANALALRPLCVVVVVRPDLPALLESLDGLPVTSGPPSDWNFTRAISGCQQTSRSCSRFFLAGPTAQEGRARRANEGKNGGVAVQDAVSSPNAR